MRVAGQSPLQGIRRNHALEHATLHVLEETWPGLKLAGRSDWSGFWVYGQVSTDMLASAVEIALQRLQSGEDRLAIHPYCGTNLVASIALATLAAQAAFRNRKRPVWRRIGLWLIGMASALVLAKPLGFQLQRSVTTQADVPGLSIVGVHRRGHGRRLVHHVETAWGPP